MPCFWVFSPMFFSFYLYIFPLFIPVVHFFFFFNLRIDLQLLSLSTMMNSRKVLLAGLPPHIQSTYEYNTYLNLRNSQDEHLELMLKSFFYKLWCTPTQLELATVLNSWNKVSPKGLKILNHPTNIDSTSLACSILAAISHLDK